MLIRSTMGAPLMTTRLTNVNSSDIINFTNEPRF